MTVPDTFRPAGANPTLRAAAMVVTYAFLIGFTDNWVRVIAAEGGLWQFHATRTGMAAALLFLLARPLGLSLRPRRPRAVLARSLIHAVAMVIYFGCLAFLSVAEVAAGLFTAPIFVLILSRFVYGHPIGPFRVLAVLVGFAGVMLVLGFGLRAVTPAMVLPIVAGLFYALGNLATREWCAGETAETLLLGFFLGLGFFGLIGMAVLSVWNPEVAEGTAGFVLRGPVWPSSAFLFWTFVQAAGSLLGVGLMIRAYQVAEASRVAVFEYAILPMSALWTWAIWGEGISLSAVLGMALIVFAGAIIALRAR
ncbi:DMT family transporter [Frigidibacter sp. SD6-1]|uniref:DMT family transporter n=1 Tax=Frigidibacter sp. SD6-1 TaxID=3032581 RepID=UPI0024DFD4E0|nr:DMT family transporter [Frigidibacter sp. SD6-1]